MKIVHICLACFYVDKMAYQENLLPKYHSERHETCIITSGYSFDANGNTIEKQEEMYRNEYGILVKVLKKSKSCGAYSRYGRYDYLYETLIEMQPDIIFCHGGQFVSLKEVIRYCKKHNDVKLFIDQHGDYYNTPVNTLRRRLGQRWIYGWWMRRAVPYVHRFWGVTPWRCEYLNDVYGIPKEKIGFLPMGGDDEKIHFQQREQIRQLIRQENDISPNDILLITGGKIDKAKRIDILMGLVAKMNLSNVKLLVFGQANECMQSQIEKLAKDSHIRYIGWIPSDKVYDYYLAADLAVFPGTHSVLWEQACACGLPGIFRDWPGMHHVNIDGSAVFFQSEDELEECLKEICTNKERLSQMSLTAQTKSVRAFSYQKIAKQAILED